MLREICKEIGDLIFVWTQYFRYEVCADVPVRKFWNSLGIGGVLSLLVCGILWLKSAVYAQGEIALEPAHQMTLSAAVSWLMSGGLISALVGFARARYSRCKRLVDIIVSGTGLLICSPLFLIVAVLVKMDSDGPVFFRQRRLGRDGKPFHIYKFRSMRQNAELDTGAVWAQDCDPRVTRFGRFLRKSHLDEIPQLYNVFRGDMSLVGPRPERPELQVEINRYVPGFDRRLRIKPGITGLAQARYQYGATMKDSQRKLKYDLIYAQRMCWALDFMIVWWTMGRVMTGEGAR